MQIPEAILPPLESPDEERKNLKFMVDRENIDVDLWILGDGEARGDVKEVQPNIATVEMQAFKVNVRLHTTKNAMFVLNLRAEWGNVTLALPRSFCGLITTHSIFGKVELSPALSPCATAVSETREERKYFVSRDGVEAAGSQWRGSTIMIKCNVHSSRIKLSYVDEQAEPPRKARPGWKLFGGSVHQ